MLTDEWYFICNVSGVKLNRKWRKTTTNGAKKKSVKIVRQLALN